MKKIIVLTLILFNNQVYGQGNKKENFDKFFEEFSFNDGFQKNRIKFPLLTLQFNDDKGALDTLYVKANDWKYNSFYFRTEWQARGQIYDSFRHELKDTDERVFEWIGIGNDVDDLYFFKRIDDKWYLIKQVYY
jgi:hypothetical protein